MLIWRVNAILPLVRHAFAQTIGVGFSGCPVRCGEAEIAGRTAVVLTEPLKSRG
jgi:hypothetical protein